MEQSDSNPPIQPTAKGIPPHNESEGARPKTQTNAQFPANVIPTPKHEAESYYTKPDPTPFWKILLEAAVGIAVISYTIVASLQLRTMNKTYQQIRDQTAIAQKGFDIFYRPYVGLDGIKPIYISRSAPVTGRGSHSKESIVGMKFEAIIKNFGSYPGSNFKCDWRVFFGGVELPGGKIPDTPRTLYPNQTVLLVGAIGEDEYPDLASGAKKLVAETTVEYDGPSGHYKECQKSQYSDVQKAFSALGDCDK